MRTAYELTLPPREKARAGLYLPLPPGPYIKLHQGDPRAYSYSSQPQGILELPWGKAILLVNASEILTEFTLEWGSVVVGSVEGRAAVVGWHYDTSD